MTTNVNSKLNEVRARFGLIIPSSNRMAELHAWRYTPPNVIPHVARVRMTGPYFMELKHLLPEVERAAATLADAKCDFTKGIGAEFNWRGWGPRSKRYTMLLESGVIKKLVVEEGKCELTAAENFLKEIK